jgi:hypothetical protein
MELVIYINDEKDFSVLEPLLNRMKLRFERKNNVRTMNESSSTQEKVESARAQLLQMLKEEVDVSSYGDPVAWQKETRRYH